MASRSSQREHLDAQLERPLVEQPAADDPRANWDREQMRRDQEARERMMEQGFGGMGQ